MPACKVCRWLLFVLLVTAGTVGLQADVASARPFAAETIADYVSQVSEDNLRTVATDLTSLFGPRREDAYSPFIDANCTTSSTVYPKTTLDMSADYIKAQFEAMGYPAAAITMELLPGNAGQNVFVTKLGSVYPNVFLEFSGHYDSVSSSPGGADNASGSSAVIELARILKDYPNRYSMRFVLWAAEEYHVQRGAYYGSNYHVQQALARGEQFKAGLVMDHIGWPYPGDPTGYMNELSYNDAESERIVDLFDQVRGTYGIDIGFGSDVAIQNSDEHSYWAFGQTAVSSGGGWLFYRPNYHDCGDTVDNINFTNVARAAQQNLAVGLILDAEDGSPNPTPTATAVPQAGFPSTGVLDNFDRPNGPMGGNWSGSTAGYAIAENLLDVGQGDDAYWGSTPFGADQEAYVTLASIDPGAGEIGLVLRAQNNSDYTQGLVDVVFIPAARQVQVWTYAAANGWVQSGASISADFVDGDQFGARATADRRIEVYQNGNLLGVRDLTGWPYATSGGYIGLFTLGGENVNLDSFGGGTVGSSSTPTATPVAPTSTATAIPTATPVAPTSTVTAIPTNTPVAPTATATATPTNTQVAPTATATATPTDTPVAPTSTATPTNSPGGFPSTGLLDDFNRANGSIGPGWSGNVDDYRIVSNQLDVGVSEDVYWNASSFGAGQEVYVTLNSIDSNGSEIGLILLSQSSSDYSPGLVDVVYDPGAKQVQIWTYADNSGWVQYGSNIPVTFVAGDQFGVRARLNGDVEVYQNGGLLGVRSLTGWPHVGAGGYVGLFHLDAAGTVLDGFGGGNTPNP